MGAAVRSMRAEAYALVCICWLAGKSRSSSGGAGVQPAHWCLRVCAHCWLADKSRSSCRGEVCSLCTGAHALVMHPVASWLAGWLAAVSTALQKALSAVLQHV